MIAPWRSASELARLIGEVADVDWRHPAWWGVTAGAALLEAAARERPAAGELYATFLAANGSPRADTFMARPLPGTPRPPAARIALAVRRARAAAAALARHASEFPGQPLAVSLAWDRGWLRREPLAGAPTVAFTAGGSVWLATPGGDAVGLAGALAGALAGDRDALPRVHASDPRAVPAAICVSLDEQPLLVARHLHRTAWTRGGGPWLGVGATAELELVTTCHLAVDGYGHARVTASLLAALDAARDLDAPLTAAAARRLDGRRVPPVTPAVPGAEPLGFAGALLPGDGPAPPFARLAYAFGRALERTYRAGLPPARRRAARRTPTFQIPVASGARDDAARRLRRPLIALTSVRMHEGVFEPFDAFRARLAAQLEREARAQGLLTRILAATAAAPVPPALRRRLLASSKSPSPWLPPVEALGGRGQLSSMRFLDGEHPPAPLYACSTPSLPASPADPRGSIVLTLVHHEGGAITASVVGTGLAATPPGAQRILDAWREELSAAPWPRSPTASTAPSWR